MRKSVLIGGLGAFSVLALILGILAERYFKGATLLAPALVAGAWVVVSAALGRTWAIKCVFIGYAIFPELGLGRIVHAAFWAAMLLIGLTNLPASLPLLKRWFTACFLAYFLFAIASAGWSEDKVLTLGAAGSMLSVYLFSLATVARLGLRDTLRTLAVALTLIVVLSLLLAVVAPDRALWHGFGSQAARLKGVTSHPTKMAVLAGLFLVCVWVAWRDRLVGLWSTMVAALVGFVCLMATNARAVIVLTAVAIVATIRQRGIALVAGAAVAVGVGVLVLSVPGAVDDFGRALSRGDNVERGLTLSGRTGLWETAIERFAERPWIGYGYYQRVIFNEAALLNEDTADASAHAHNSILQSLVCVGLVGTLLLVPVFVAQIAHVLRSPRSQLAPFIAFFLLIGLVQLGGLQTKASFAVLAFMLTSVSGLAALDRERRALPDAARQPGRRVAPSYPTTALPARG